MQSKFEISSFAFAEVLKNLRSWAAAICLIQARGMRVGSKIGTKFAYFLAFCKKIGENWWRCLWEFFMRHLGSKRRYTFYTAAIGRLVTLRAGD